MQKNQKKIIPGASINPLRKDWDDELSRCIDAKVQLIKWLPGVMGFNPADKKIKPFFEKVKQADITILTHVGFEYAVSSIDQSFTELDNLEQGLDIGVKIIAAHCCGGRPIIDSRKQFFHMVNMAEKYPNLFFDISGMASFHRKSRLANAINHTLIHERLVYGSDYPIPVHQWAFKNELKKKFGNNLSSNPFDLDIQIKKAMGASDDVFSRGLDIIKV